MGMKGPFFMYAPIRRFNLIAGLFALVLGFSLSLQAASEPEPAAPLKRGEASLYQDMFDQSVYYEGTNLLRFDRIYRKLFRKKLRARDVNAFDEVPDSGFFENRQAREKLSTEELRRGVNEPGDPDLSGELTIFYAEAEANPPKFWVRDAKGEAYLLKFDPQDSLELATSAEVIANRFYQAIGYNVFPDTLVVFPPEKLVLGQGAVIYDSSGFKKTFTQEKLQELVLFIPADAQGNLRASSIKLPKTAGVDGWSFTGLRPKNPEDTIEHAKRRSIRALQVFGSWLNNDDTRGSAGSSRMAGDKNSFKYYLTDLDSALGAGNQGPKPPTFSHEHMVDYGQTAKAFLAFGFWEKPWQKRWREAGETIHSPAVGYFDNAYFDPAKFKTQLPYYAFKDLTLADGFWAAKTILSFSEENIRAIVKSGQYSDANDEKYVADTLIERRSLVGRYWLKNANPLDEFDVSGSKLVFKDLAVQYGFSPEGKSVYHVDVLEKHGKKAKKIASFDLREPALSLQPEWAGKGVSFLIRTLRPGASKPGPYVLVELGSHGVTGISHQD